MLITFTSSSSSKHERPNPSTKEDEARDGEGGILQCPLLLFVLALLLCQLGRKVLLLKIQIGRIAFQVER